MTEDFLKSPKGDEDQGPRVFRRTHYVVNPAFQYKYTLMLSGLGLVLSVGFGAWLYLAHRENSSLIELTGALAEEIEAVDRRFIWTLMGFVGALTTALFFAGVLITHRMAGPLFLMSRYLKELAAGRIPKPRELRQGDEFQETFSQLSSAMSFLRNHEHARKEVLREALAHLRHGRTEEACQALEQELARIEAFLGSP